MTWPKHSANRAFRAGGREPPRRAGLTIERNAAFRRRCRLTMPLGASGRGCGLVGCRPTPTRSMQGLLMRHLRFDNLFVRELPADAQVEPRPRQVHGAL